MLTLTLVSLGALGAPAALPSRLPESPEAHAAVNTAVSSYVAHLAAAEHTEAVVPADPIPSFSRQTGLACSVCHTTFPHLTAFGRMFKLTGYTLTAEQTVQQQDSTRSSLRIDLIPPISAMFMASATSVRRSVPGEQNQTMAFPQEMGVFMGGAITPKLGGFFQLTYDPSDGGVGIDNADIRFADNTSLFGKPLQYGVTLNNSPSVQDLWNSTPTWRFPYTSSETAPAPTASALVDGSLEQQVIGLGTFGMWQSKIYAEVTGYRSSFQGGPLPIDGSAENVIHGVAPYWRVAYLRDLAKGSFMLGSFGMFARLNPSGFEGPRDRYTDVAFDTQWDREWPNGASVVAHGSWIHESRHLAGSLEAGGADHLDGTLNTARADATWTLSSGVGLSAGLFSTSGSTDAALYAPDAVTGSASGSPDSRGYVAQITFMPWLNTRLGVQYMGYTRFDGAARNYDGAGRDASDNNTLYLVTWLVF